jgi:hypothetical protein
MAKSGRLIAGVVVIVVLVWLFAFGGISTLLSLVAPSPGPAPGGAFSDTIRSIDAAGNGVVQIAPDGKSGTVSGSRTTLAAENVVTITLIIQQTPAASASSVAFTLGIDNPSYNSGGNVFYLVRSQANGCPMIAYTVGASSSGSGAPTSNPCGFSGSVPSGGAMTLTMGVSVNPAFFSNSPFPAQYAMPIHIMGGDDVKVTWVITS